MEPWNRLAIAAQEEPADFYRRVLTTVLDVLTDQVGGLSKMEKVKMALRKISQMYKGGLSVASSQFRSDWNDPANRCAYVFLYFMQHCHLVDFSLQYTSNIVNSWRNKGSLKVCSIGGGPGSDLVGLTTFLRKKGIFPNSLECRVLDLYPNWKDTWDTIHQCIPEYFRIAYERCDVVRDTELPVSTRQFIRQADILTLVKFFSAVSAFFRDDPGCGDLLRSILRVIKPGCFVLYIDNNHVSDTQFEREFASPVGLVKVFEFRGKPALPFGQYSGTVKNYCLVLDYTPMCSCNVLIQLYVRLVVQPASPPGSISQVRPIQIKPQNVGSLVSQIQPGLHRRGSLNDRPSPSQSRFSSFSAQRILAAPSPSPDLHQSRAPTSSIVHRITQFAQSGAFYHRSVPQQNTTSTTGASHPAQPNDRVQTSPVYPRGISKQVSTLKQGLHLPHPSANNWSTVALYPAKPTGLCLPKADEYLNVPLNRVSYSAIYPRSTPNKMSSLKSGPHQSPPGNTLRSAAPHLALPTGHCLQRTVKHPNSPLSPVPTSALWSGSTQKEIPSLKKRPHISRASAKTFPTGAFYLAQPAGPHDLPKTDEHAHGSYVESRQTSISEQRSPPSSVRTVDSLSERYQQRHGDDLRAFGSISKSVSTNHTTHSAYSEASPMRLAAIKQQAESQIINPSMRSTYRSPPSANLCQRYLGEGTRSHLREVPISLNKAGTFSLPVRSTGQNESSKKMIRRQREGLISGMQVSASARNQSTKSKSASLACNFESFMKMSKHNNSPVTQTSTKRLRDPGNTSEASPMRLAAIKQQAESQIINPSMRSTYRSPPSANLCQRYLGEGTRSHLREVPISPNEAGTYSLPVRSTDQNESSKKMIRRQREGLLSGKQVLASARNQSTKSKSASLLACNFERFMEMSKQNNSPVTQTSTIKQRAESQIIDPSMRSTYRSPPSANLCQRYLGEGTRSHLREAPISLNEAGTSSLPVRSTDQNESSKKMIRRQREGLLSGMQMSASARNQSIDSKSASLAGNSERLMEISKQNNPPVTQTSTRRFREPNNSEASSMRLATSVSDPYPRHASHQSLMRSPSAKIGQQTSIPADEAPHFTSSTNRQELSILRLRHLLLLDNANQPPGSSLQRRTSMEPHEKEALPTKTSRRTGSHRMERPAEYQVAFNTYKPESSIPKSMPNHFSRLFSSYSSDTSSD